MPLEKMMIMCVCKKYGFGQQMCTQCEHSAHLSPMLAPLDPSVDFAGLKQSYVLLVLHIVCKHGLVQAWGSRLPVFPFTFSVLV